MPVAERITGCRVCGEGGLHPVVDLGRTALANRFLAPAQLGDPEPTFPLRLVRCDRCGHLQIDQTVSPEVLFADYVYVSGTSDLIRRHADRLADQFCERYGLGTNDLVAELASNDGTVLRAFRRHGVRVLGVEPAANIAERARADGVPTVTAFFDAGVGRRLRRDIGPAKLIVARHVLAHVADLHGFVQGAADWLADDGVAAFEVPHLLPFFAKLEYDTVYHEHLCYYSVRVLERLFAGHGLELIDVEEVAVHGGSVVVSAQRRGGPHFARESVEDVLLREAAAGLHRAEPWAGFAGRVAASRDLLRHEVADARRKGRTLAAYGAAAKGMTLLAYCGFGPAEIPYIVDRSSYKQGLYTPGHHIPVVPPERLATDPPDVLLVLAWNFAAEVMAQQEAYRARGGRFLLPLPAPHYAGEAVPAGEEAVIDGVTVVPLRQIPDERGKVMHMLRRTDPHFREFGEVYFSVVLPGVIKGWHLHRRMVINYAVPFGRIKLVLFDDREASPTFGGVQELFVGQDNYCLVSVPVGVWNGFKGYGTTEAIVCNCATIVHDPDEIERLDPFDPRIPYDWSLKHR